MAKSDLSLPPDLSQLLYESGRPGPLNLSVISPRTFDPTSTVVRRMVHPHRTNHYFLLFVRTGSVTYTVDLRPITVEAGQVLFVQPHQVRVPPASKSEVDFFKITFDQACLAMLPRTYRFWLDPLSSQKIELDSLARERVWALLPLLEETWAQGTASDLVVAYLQTLMAELETSYFSGAERFSRGRNLAFFLRFKEVVEETFSHQPKVAELANLLGQSETGLYTVVKEFSGLSPKEYLTKRTIVEAQRLLFYSRLSVKELAQQLGFDDESYFSRLFKKEVGQGVAAFAASLEEKSGTPEDLSIPGATSLQ